MSVLFMTAACPWRLCSTGGVEASLVPVYSLKALVVTTTLTGFTA